MTAFDQAEQHVQIYRRFSDILNQQDFDAPEVVDPAMYHEACVGFTPGRVNLLDAITAFKQVLAGIPDLHAQIDDCVAQNKVYAQRGAAPAPARSTAFPQRTNRTR